ncbi:MBL fold metallo-hydrolase [Geitlerinema sp. PCC 7407]|uniref:MBL fold metallo-hydrolase n=1 Tax=Geitlerinema sp. PCC 7407 TaxID=1173025 RepID=UPI001CC022F9|nr:MBL fold metallo-hydrolase [Geitlerinema sp. PCC 7407]
MYPDSQPSGVASPVATPLDAQPSSTAKPPRLILDSTHLGNGRSIYAFAPNRDTLGGTAYFIVENGEGILIDCPAWNDVNQRFLQEHAVRWFLITHRGGLGKTVQWQQQLQCDVLIQEQEAYLLPEITVTTFHRECQLSPSAQALWTSGHSPGSACLYYQPGGVLFTGRHLLPDRDGNPAPLRTSKTFHWPRQLRNTAGLRSRFSPETLRYICPGASTGSLRGQGYIDHAYEKLAAIDLDALQGAIPLL